MNKLSISILLMAFALSLDACMDKKHVGFEMLPDNAQKTITQHFGKDAFLFVSIEREVLFLEYDVSLKDGTDLEFDRDGNLKSIDCLQQRIPEGIVPEKVLAYVNANHPDAYITKWGMDDLRWKAELNNDLELIFDHNGEFYRYDD